MKALATGKYGFTRTALPGYCLDPSHVEMLYRLLLLGGFRRVLEVGCFTGASTCAYFEALEQGAEFELHLCDVEIRPEIHRLLGMCAVPERVHLHQRQSLEVLDGTYDLVFLDGDHRLPAVVPELERLLRQGAPTILAHDTSNWRPNCDGTRYLREALRNHPEYHVLEDNALRSGEETTRGLLLATRDRELFERVRADPSWSRAGHLEPSAVEPPTAPPLMPGADVAAHLRRNGSSARRTRLAHVVPLISVGGTENLLLSLCRFQDHKRFESVVCSMWEPVSVIADEIRATGTAVVSGHAALEPVLEWADVVNIHCWGADRAYLDLVRHKPHVITLHWQLALPDLPSVCICTSDYVRSIQADPRRFVAIPNGVDLVRFHPRPRPPRDEVVITRICRPPKCAPYFWDAMHRVLARFPQVRLRIVGNDEPCTHPDPRVEFLGIRRDIPEILADTDIFVYTPYPEIGTKDLVVMEASACGVPCVVSDVSVVRESVHEGRNGYLTPFGDVDALADRVEQLVAQPHLRRHLGETAAALARERFDMRDAVRRYEAVYSAVLARGRAAAVT